MPTFYIIDERSPELNSCYEIEAENELFAKKKLALYLNRDTEHYDTAETVVHYTREELIPLLTPIAYSVYYENKPEPGFDSEYILQNIKKGYPLYIYGGKSSIADIIVLHGMRSTLDVRLFYAMLTFDKPTTICSEVNLIGEAISCCHEIGIGFFHTLNL